MPSPAVGIVSLGALAVALLGRYGYRLAGPGRWLYVGGALLSLSRNGFVAVERAFPAFQKLLVRVASHQHRRSRRSGSPSCSCS